MRYKGVHSFLVRPRRPLAITKRLYQEREELAKENLDYQKKTKEQVLKINELEKDLQEKELIIENQKVEIAAAKLDAETHLEALDKAEQ